MPISDASSKLNLDRNKRKQDFEAHVREAEARSQLAKSIIENAEPVVDPYPNSVHLL